MMVPEVVDESPPLVTPRLLRQFAALWVLVFGSMFLANVVRHEGRPSPGGWAAGAVAVLVGLPGLVRPSWIRPVYGAATAATRPIGHVIGIALLAVVYYGLITPLAVGFRLLGRDPLALRRRDASTYWIPRGQPDDVRLYLRQFQQTTRSPGPEHSPEKPSMHAETRDPKTPA